jgi:hypothetical protein
MLAYGGMVVSITLSWYLTTEDVPRKKSCSPSDPLEASETVLAMRIFCGCNKSRYMQRDLGRTLDGENVASAV